VKRRHFLVVAPFLALPFGARAQRAPRIGAIAFSSIHSQVVEGLRAGLKERGMREGSDFALEVFNAKGDLKTVEEAARRFEREPVQLIFVVPTVAAIPVKRATSRVPVFFCVGTDPVAAGLVESFARPGGRFTGAHYLTTDLTAKRLELLKELLPKTRRVVMIYDPKRSSILASAGIARDASARLGIELIERHAASVDGVRAAIGSLKPREADALFLIADAVVASQAQLIVDRAREIRMPTMVYEQTMAERGALASYGVSYFEIGRESAKNVQRLLAGARPGELPVENVTRLAFVLNLRTAREIGVAVPPAMLVRFDRVIE
jgi:putative ABC transport system substrate-binding protein